MPESALRQSLQAARANLGPGLVLQAFAFALVAAYTWHEPTRAALDRVADYRTEVGHIFAVVSTAVFGAVVPWLVLQMRASTRGRYNLAQFAALIVFWAYKGLEVSVFYGLQARWFGEGGDFVTIASKTLVDQLGYSTLIAVPSTWFYYGWVEHRFNFAPVLADFRRPGWYARCCLPLVIATWGVWLPVLAVIYLLPTALQLPMQNIVLCFFTLLIIFMSKRPAQPAPAN